MKKNKFVILLGVLLITISINSLSFAKPLDVEGHWAKNDIEYLIGAGIVSGYEDGSFRPNRNITRAEFIKLVNNIFEYEEVKEIAFQDVGKDHWFYEDIRKAVAAAYIGGYDDNTMRPERPITRQEASKIVAVASGMGYEVSDSAKDFSDIDEIGSWSVNHIGVLRDKGYMDGYSDGSFKPKEQITRAETSRLLSNIRKDLVENNEEEVVEVEDEIIEEVENENAETIDTEVIVPAIPLVKTEDEKFVELIEGLREAREISTIVVGDKQAIEKAKSFYNTLSEEEKSKVPSEIMDKYLEVDRKIESLKTPIRTSTKSSVEQAQIWAIKKGAHKRFVDIAPRYWYKGELTGVNPEIIYAQAAKETAFGKYTGAVRPEMNNWAGIKTDNPVADNTYDHEIFETAYDGVRAHFNHMGIYCGIEPMGQPHPRWYITNTVNWAGTIQYAEDLGGRWAPNPDYGISIVRDYVRPIYETETTSKEALYKALAFSDKLENLIEEVENLGEEELMELIMEYNSLNTIEKSLIPYNIVEDYNLLIQKLDVL